MKKYVCDACGTNEGMLAFMRNPLPLNEWACFAPNRPESDLETLTVPAATRQLRQKQIPYLCGVFEKWLDDKTGTDFRVYQHEAYENCPGFRNCGPTPSELCSQRVTPGSTFDSRESAAR